MHRNVGVKIRMMARRQSMRRQTMYHRMRDLRLGKQLE